MLLWTCWSSPFWMIILGQGKLPNSKQFPWQRRCFTKDVFPPPQGMPIILASRELTYPTLGKGNHLQNAILGGYVSSLEGNHFIWFHFKYTWFLFPSLPESWKRLCIGPWIMTLLGRIYIYIPVRYLKIPCQEYHPPLAVDKRHPALAYR